MPSIAEMAQPMLRLAGRRINPATNGPFSTSSIAGLRLRGTDGRADVRVELPAGVRLGAVRWSPDGTQIAFTNTVDAGVELWVADTRGRARRLTGPELNAVAGTCSWMPDGARLLCPFVVDDRGAPPPEPRVPAGPTVLETYGRTAPVRTYQDLLDDEHDEALFDYYFTAQLALVDAGTGRRTPVGAPAIFDDVEPAPDGEHILVARVVRPYSYLVTVGRFPQEIEIWNTRGDVVDRFASLSLQDAVPIRGVPTGPRSIDWRPDRPATLVWVEALDGGDPSVMVTPRDRVLELDAPFDGEPRTLAQTFERYGGIRWTADGLALLSDRDRSRRWTRTCVMDANRPGSEMRLLWDRSSEDAYGDPGSPIMTQTATGHRVLLQDGMWIFLEGNGYTPDGARPFFDRLDLRTLETERLWRSADDAYEQVAAVLDTDGARIVTRHESPTEPPNYFVLDLESDMRTALTAFPDPAPQLRSITKQLVTYERDDGVPLSATLYLPAGYRQGMRMPVVMWAYPREFVSAAAAGQVRAAPNRYSSFSGPSHLFFLTQGYAVLDGPTMPIVGGDSANDTYIEQLVASARAAVDAVVDMGVADANRIGIGGHSYGAFMTANLLAHSDLFAAGIARSGAYNRTLTPFGFQNEPRTFWEAPDLYFRMSPFMHADELDEPLLMIHGEADSNSGTFPIQSERLYMALKGLGGTTRLVWLPHESHGYRARESVLHTLAEMVEWFDRYVKN